jgi:hypothetical protein
MSDKDVFIKTYPVFSKEYCEEVIQIFENLISTGCGQVRNDNVKRDTQMELSPVDAHTDLKNLAVAEVFFNTINETLSRYIKELGVGFIGQTYSKHMLVQRSNADNFESYSAWHCEQDGSMGSDRAFVYMLYLNDDFEGGETEFLFQKHKEIPVTGNLVIWPAGYTHTHRGAMLMKGKKYIATGWVHWLPC